MILHRCVICGELNAELLEADRYRCRTCGAVFSDGFRRLVDDMGRVGL